MRTSLKSMSRGSRFWRRGPDLLVLVFFFGIAVATTWPLALRITTHLAGGTLDTLVHYWNGWWVRESLTTGQTPFRTSLIFYPEGVSLAYHNFAWINIAAWLLAQPVIGGYAAYNLAVLVNLAMCGFAAFLLARDLTQDTRAALLAGLVYQCWPYRLHQLDHPNLISTYWIPLFLLSLMRAVRRERWGSAVLAGGFLALTGYARWQLLVPAGMLGAVCVVCALLDRRISRRYLALVVVVAVGVAAIALAPAAILLGPQWSTDPAQLLVEEEEATMQTDLLAYVTPSSAHPMMGSVTGPAYDRYYADRSSGRRFPAYIGASVMALVLLGVIRVGRDSLPWVVAGALFILLALGPVLRVGGQMYPAVPMPYGLASRLFLVRLLRFPDRYTMFLALPIAVLVSYGSTAVLARVSQRARWVHIAATCLLVGAVLFEYLAVPVPLQRPQLSGLYSRLAAESGEFAVLNLPLDPQQSKLYMFAQISHRRPILQGKTARLSEEVYGFVDRHPWLQGLRLSGEMLPQYTDVGRQLRSLADDGVRYVILHKDPVDASRLARWRRHLLVSPRFEDGDLAVYTTAAQAGRDFDLVQELAPGIGPIAIVTSTACLNPGGVLEVDVGWGATAAQGRDLDVNLSLETGEGIVGQEEAFPVSRAWPVSEWPAGAVAWGYYVVHARESLPAGSYDVALRLSDPDTGRVWGREASVGRIEVSTETCSFDTPRDAVVVNGLFGSELRLLGYALRREDDGLNVTLHWRSERRMATAYKTFVHVFDPESQSVVAQYDAMPRQWTYPTTWWGAGEEVTDSFSIPLGGVPGGTYQIAVGVYDPATMERLPVVNDAGQSEAEDRLVLTREAIEVRE